MPKIAAFLVLVIALVPGAPQLFIRLGAAWPILTVTLVIALGGLWGGARVLQVLACDVASMDNRSGLVANLSASLLVLAVTPLGLPVSTTHVSISSLIGIRWSDSGQSL